MSQIVLTLGPVKFQDFEIPERIGFGGKQRLAVHNLPGAERVIDALGPLPEDITWSGIFSGPEATLRARVLDQLRIQALALPLQWDVFSYRVVIAAFTVEYRSTAWVPYTLRCTVLQDEAQASAGIAESLVADVLADVASAAGLAASGGYDLSALQAGLSVGGSATTGTAAWRAAGAAMSVAQAGINLGLANAGAGFGMPLGNADDVNGMIGNCGQAANLASAGAYLGRAATNLFDGGF